MNICKNKKGFTDALKPILTIAIFIFVAVVLFSLSARLVTEQKASHKEALIDYYNESEGMTQSEAIIAAEADDSFNAVEELQEEQNRLPGYFRLIIGIIIGAIALFVIFKYIMPWINAM